MRHPAIRFAFLFALALFATVAVSVVSPREAAADARAEAKTHYQAGVKAYNAADYRSAIKEFSAAQQLAPADLNNYNLALCYDKLGEAEPAIQYYKEYLAKVPSAQNRAEIEASVARLEGALQSAATKRAEEARKAEDARKAEEARKAAEAAAAGTGGASGPGTAGSTGVGRPTGTEGTPGTGTPDANGGVTVGASGSVGTSGTPGTGQVVSTGDAQLDRAAQIDISSIRDQRIGAGTVDPGAAGPAGAQGAAAAGAGTNPGTQANSTQPATGGSDPNAPTDQPKKATPIYKKWWFWAVVVVSAFVVYQIATTDSNSNAQARTVSGALSRPIPASPAPDMGGATLLSW